MAPLISIIIPTYNSAKTLPDCLDSIISQTFIDYEVLIINGLSNDDTVAIAKSYNNNKIKVFSEKDNGIYDAMNKGIRLSSGAWLYFIGSDDSLFDSNVLKSVSDVLQNSKSEMVYGNVIINGTPQWGYDGQIYDGEFSVGTLLRKNIAHQAIFYKKDIFDVIGNYNITYKVCADYDINLRVASKFKMRHVDLIIAIFNAGGVSTHTMDELFFSEFDTNVFKYYKNKLFATYMRSFSNSMINGAKRSIKSGDIVDALGLLFPGYYHKVINKFKPTV